MKTSYLTAWVVLVALVPFGARGQQRSDAELEAAIRDIFTTPSTSFLSDFGEVVTQKPAESFGAVERCGEGADAGVHACVPYYNCDGTTRTIIQTGSTDGFGIIDIRLGQSACDHFLDVCCGIPKDGIPPEITTQKPVVDPNEPVVSSTIPPVTPGRGNFCGIRNNNGIDFKIVGNKDNEAEYAEFPWMIEILLRQPNGLVQAICGAALITPNVVITGGHCVNKVKTTDIFIRAGEWDTQTTRERVPYQERDVSDIIIHPEFNPKTVFNNVALLILSRPLKKADNIGTICLPPPGLVNNAQECFVTGWGKSMFGSQSAPSVILKKIRVPMVPFNECQRALRTTRLGALFNLHDSFVCAGGKQGQDACTGDGGGPLVCPDPNNPKRYQLTGIVSWGIGCGENGVPGVYADVAKFRDWVDGEMGKQFLDTKPYTV